MRFILLLIPLLVGCMSTPPPQHEAETLAVVVRGLMRDVQSLEEAEKKMVAYLEQELGPHPLESQQTALKAYAFGCKSIRQDLLEELDVTLSWIEQGQIKNTSAVDRIVVVFEHRLIEYMRQYSHPAVPQKTAWYYIGPTLQRLKSVLSILAEYDDASS